MDGKNTFRALRLQAHSTAIFDARDILKRCVTMGYGTYLLQYFGAPGAALTLACLFLAIETFAYGLRRAMPENPEEVSDPMIVLTVLRVVLAVNLFSAAGVLLILQPHWATAVIGLIFLSGVGIHSITAHMLLPMMNWILAPSLAWAFLLGGYLIPNTPRADLRGEETALVLVASLLWVVSMFTTIARQSGTRRAFSVALVTARDRAERLAYLARHDGLTGLLTRAAFDEVLRDALQFGPDRGQLAVMLLDLDKFKPVNDTHGHAAGDAALVEMARRITEVLGEENAARLGGDEFVGLISGVRSRAHVEQMAQRLKARLSEPVIHDGAALEIGASIGVAFAGGADEDLSALIARADRAMYAAKSINSAAPIFAEDTARAG